MVLPGISGSSLLMSFGLYLPVITGFRGLLSFDFSALWLLISLGLGILAGVTLTLRAILKLLEKRLAATIYTITGMMLGSLYAIIAGPETLKIPRPAMTLSTFSLPLFIIGAACIAGLLYLRKRVGR